MPITVKTADGNTRRIIMRQGKEQNTGTKHSIFRHYNTGSGVINADDISLIPDVIANGTRTVKNNGKIEYKYTHNNGTKYTVLTEKNNRGAEVFADFYTNKSGSARSSNTQLSAQADSITALSADKDNINSVNNKTFFRTIAADDRTADYALDSIEQATPCHRVAPRKHQRTFLFPRTRRTNLFCPCKRKRDRGSPARGRG